MNEQIETSLCHIAKFAPFDDISGASHFPIYNTGTFDLKKQKGDKIYDYTRSDNPTREVLENLFTHVENGAGCVCTHTGIACVSLLFETVLKANSHILVEADCYGGTFRLLKIFKEKYNITVHFADFLDFEMLEHILKTNPIDLVLCESPTNPGLKIIDLKSKYAKALYEILEANKYKETVFTLNEKQLKDQLRYNVKHYRFAGMIREVEKVYDIVKAKIEFKYLNDDQDLLEYIINNFKNERAKMDNQHRKIKGYRELNQEEIDAMNEVKAMGVKLGELVEKLENNKDLDQRWIESGKTDLQKGLMALTRSIARPEFF
mgnify:CR=1 FL=1